MAQQTEKWTTALGLGLLFQGFAIRSNALLQVAARQAGGEQCDESAHDASYEHTMWHLWHLHVQRNQVQHAQGGCGGRELPGHPGLQVSCLQFYNFFLESLRCGPIAPQAGTAPVSLKIWRAVIGSTSGVRHVLRRSL